MTPSDTLLLIPTYNERENITGFIETVLASVPDLNILVLDDGSPDGTADLVDSHFAGEDRVEVLRRTGPRGLGLSYVEGYQIALRKGYRQVAQMDADFSHDPKELPSLVSLARQGNVAFGSRYCPGGGVRNWPLKRRLLSRFANLYVATVAGIPTRDATSGYRVYPRTALEAIEVGQVVSNGYAFQVEMTYRLHRAGQPIREHPITFTDRTLGKSKMSGGVIMESVVMPWKLRFGRVGREVRTEKPASAPDTTA